MNTNSIPSSVMEDIWHMLCPQQDCIEKECGVGFVFLNYTTSCIPQAFILSVNIILQLLFLFSFRKRKDPIRRHSERLSCLEVLSTALVGCLGLTYLGLGIWMLEENLTRLKTSLPLYWWVVLFQGFTWLLATLMISLRRKNLSKCFVKLGSVLACIFTGIICGFAVLDIMANKEASVRNALDILSFPCIIMFLLHVHKKYKADESGEIVNISLYTPLNGEAHGSSEISLSSNVTLLARAGFFSTMSFWWLNPLMKEGKERPLGDEDVPRLRDEDCAKSCYTLFLEQLNFQRQKSPSTSPSVLWAIIVCQWKGIVISGCFALLKILTLSCGPLLLNPFIKVAEGNKAFKYEGYVLALSLFATKCLESLSQSQWYFRIRVVGLRIRSLLSAAIYRKQMRLSNSSMLMHSPGQIINYVTVDAYRIGEFPYWFHQAWTTSLQLCIALCILVHVVGLATIVTLVAIILAVFCNTPLAKLQHKFQTELMTAQDVRLKAIARALMNMRVLKLYAWETHFKHVIEKLRNEECKWLTALQLQKAYSGFLFCSSPVLASVATFGACYFLGIPLNAGNVFTFVATLRLLQVPVRAIPDVIGMFIQAKVALDRIIKFLEAPELPTKTVRQMCNMEELQHSILISCADFSWEENPSTPTLKNINIAVTPGEKVAICGEIGSGKSTLLAAICGEVSNVNGKIQLYGKIAYVSQTAWIYTGTIQENILFGSGFNKHRYQQTLEKCSLVKDIEMLPFGDLTEIGERGINLSGGQKQRIQLARALYQDADIYLLDDPFSAVDAHTAASLFNEYVMDALSGKTVLLVTHQVNFLPVFDSVLLMSDGNIMQASSYHQLLASSQEFQALVNAHKSTAGSEKQVNGGSVQRTTTQIFEKASADKQSPASSGDQLIKIEERETGDTGLKAYLLYLCHGKGYLYFSAACLVHLIFATGQILQNSWMAANVHNPNLSEMWLIIVYLIIGIVSTFFFFARYLLVVAISVQSSKSLFLKLLSSLFHAPMSFYDATPLGRILSRVSSDLSIMDLDVPLSFSLSIGSTINTYATLGVLAVVTWPVLFVSIPMVFLIMCLQRYYLASAKELMRINGTTKSILANHLSESIGGAMTIRAFEKEDQFFAQNLNLIDINASPFFHNFAAKEWLIQRLEILSATVISSSALAMVLLPTGTYNAGFAGMALSYGISLNISLVNSIQNQCTLANHIVSVERLKQYMDIPTEAPEIIDENRPTPSWPSIGRVEIQELKIRYRPDTPLVLQGITCTFEGGHKIGVVGRTGSGKTTLISALFRLVEPVEGKIVIDGLDISTIGTHDLRSRFGIIPQDPTLFTGTVRYNLDPLCQHTDVEIWEVLKNCQLQDLVQDKGKGLYASVVEDGSNWSMGQRQLFCLGRALLRKSRILVLDEATASIDNVTDTIIQRIIRTECSDCTVITVAHRISTIMDYTKVLSINEGKLVEYDEPMKLMNREGSLFGQLVKEFWSNSELN